MGFSPKLPTPKVGGLFKMKFGGLSKIKKCLNANMENQKERKKENFSESDFDSSVNVFVFMADVLEGIKEGLYELDKFNVKEAKEMLTQGMEKGEEVVRDIMKG